MGQKVLNKRSVQVVDNSPKLPTPEQLEYGELAINYAGGHETLAIKNNKNVIVPFSSDEKIYDNVQIQIDNALVPVLSAITDITSAITDDEFVVATALTDLDDRITSVNNYSEELNTLINELSGSVMDNYSLSAVTHQEIEDAKGDILVFVNNLSGSVSTFSASVVNTYATSAKTHSAISSTNTRIDNLTQEIIDNEFVTAHALNDLNDRLEDLFLTDEYIIATALNDLNSKITTLSGYVESIPTGGGGGGDLTLYATSADTYNAIANASGNIKSYIDSKVSSAYVYKGSVTNYSDLASITTKEVGDVYNVINANGSTPAGTNYAWTGSDWDALGGTIDLSNYVENSTFTAHTGNSAIHLTTGDVKSQIEAYNYITGYTENDPTVHSWAKQPAKPTYTASEVGALATGTTLDSVPDGTTRKLSDYATQANFTAHTASTEIHVTAAQKSSWDSKVSNVQSDWNATTGLAAILNKPTIPSAPGTLNTTATASQSTNASQSLADNITLHKVSKTGSYNDLNNKPTIPTVNDNTITLTFNGATVGTFTLNQNSNKTIDIGTIIGLPSFSSANNGQILGVVNGQLTWVTPTTIYTGTGTPSASQGNDGDIYLQTS